MKNPIAAIEVQSDHLDGNLGFLYQYFPARTVHLGFVIKAGTRDEEEPLMGTAHCLEHMLFKGTTKRKYFHILTGLDKYGGELNAYTTREFTAYFASVSSEYTEKAIDLLADMFQNASMPEKELEKEKSIIGDEIDMYADTPDERIQDEFQELLFPGHPLGFNILGTRKTLANISSESLKDFSHRFYTSGNSAFFFTGNLSRVKVEQLLGKHFRKRVPLESVHVDPKLEPYKPFQKEVSTTFQQSHCMLGTRAYPHGHPLKPALALLNNMLGGPGMNSRLNIGIREKYGFTYQIDSNYQAFRDSGIFAIYFATEAGRLERTRKLVIGEIVKLTESLNERTLEQAKRQFIGQMQLAEESRLGLLLALSKGFLDLGYFDSFSEAEQRIRAVNMSDTIHVAADILQPNKLSVLVYNTASGK